MTPRVRAVDSRDIPSILEINRTVQSYPWTERDIVGELGHRHPCSKVISDEDGLVLGYLLVRSTGDDLEILTLGVDRHRQRRGLATRLLSNLIENQRGRKIYLEVCEKNKPALRLYESSGFKTIGRRKSYYRDGSDALNMAR